MKRPLLENWQRKGLALLSAITIWFLVHGSITMSKTYTDVPVRIVNLPVDKTVQGLLPSGILSKRISLTLTGYKSVLDELEPGDIEIRLDASSPPDEWVAEIDKKNLVSLNPGVDLLHNITDVVHPELLLKISRLITVKVPITITSPRGEPPRGYQYLDVWPQRLLHTISGPEEEVEELQSKGLELIFDLSEISREELDQLKSSSPDYLDDEVSFFVPSRWKRVAIPFHNNALEEINDPEAERLHIDFLRKELLPLNRRIPIRVYYPLKYLDKANPTLFQLLDNEMVEIQQGVSFLTPQLFVQNVSRMFLDVVQDNLEIVILATPPDERSSLSWSIQFVNVDDLENTYVRLLLPSGSGDGSNSRPGDRELYLRTRFRDYIRLFELAKSKDERLRLFPHYTEGYIEVLEQPSETKARL